jgi:tetratricopeptide (TPR) repeat protein
MPPYDRRLDLARAAFGGDPVIDALRQMAARGQYNEIAVIAKDASRMLSGDTLCAHLGEIRALVPQAERAWLIIAGLEASALLAAGHASPAIALARQVLQDALGRFDSDPADPGRQSDLSVSLVILRKACSIAGDPPAARSHYQAALSIAQRQADADPRNIEWQQALFICHYSLGDNARALGEVASARQAYQRSLDILTRLAPAVAGDEQWHSSLQYVQARLSELPSTH